MNRTYRLAALVLSAAIVFPSVAQAACTQGNATGRWQAIASVFSTSSDRESCALRVRANGSVADTTCLNNRGQTAPLTQGVLLLARDAPSLPLRR